ncbi:MAG: Scr1 family TA system antitoxin-like transcriptional regulator [Streptosporangiaceae bacterium]|jgi:transcriptional regulator with XRE-family HTH domain
MKAGKDASAAGHFGRQMKKERLAHSWSLQELSQRTAYDAAHLSRIEDGGRPPTRALAVACDTVFPERRGWFTEYYDESRKWAEIPHGFRDWSELEDKAATLRADITVQVLPAVAHPANASGFVLADDAVWCEHVAGGFVYTDQTVRTVLRLFDTLRSESYRASETAALLERMAQSWATGASPLTQTPTAETA